MSLALIDADPCWADVPTGNPPADPVAELQSKIDYDTLAAALAPLIRLSWPPTAQALALEIRAASDTVEILLSDPIESVARDLAYPGRVTEQERLDIGGEVLEPLVDALHRELGVVQSCRKCGAAYTEQMRSRIHTRTDTAAGVVSGECACGNTLAWEG